MVSSAAGTCDTRLLLGRMRGGNPRIPGWGLWGGDECDATQWKLLLVGVRSLTTRESMNMWWFGTYLGGGWIALHPAPVFCYRGDGR